MKRNRMEKRKVLMLLPFLILPFLAFGFYALGGGSGISAQQAALPKGINTTLPDAQFKGKQADDKMAIYNQVIADSGKMGGIDAIAAKFDLDVKEDQQTAQINEKLAAINKEINTPYAAPKNNAATGIDLTGGFRDNKMTSDVDRLETLMKNMKESSGEVDPEMVQLNAMMDKLIAVQNPDLAGQIYKKSDAKIVPDSLFKAIPAVIAANQRARQGSVVELRLLDSLVLNGVVFPKGHPLFGLAAFSNQRLNLEIKNVRLGNQVIPVNLTVFDQRDAMQGINAPEALLTDAVNGGTTDAIGGLGLSGFDLTTQIAGAGIDAAKSLLTKKIGRVKQNLKAGYPLLLRDNTKKLK
ncbi:conjugative transposon protein TraM [Pedobacter soli]|nr:conjugative transposon protein TraM [Pedobacter soli]